MELLRVNFHEIAEWFRLKGTSGSHLAQRSAQAGKHPEQVVQDHVQVGFEDLQGGKIHSLSG